MNSQISFHARPVLAGLLLILVASVALGQGRTLNVRGSFDGHGIGVVEAGTLHASAGGAGTASHIGRFTYVLNATVNGEGTSTSTSTGVFVLVFNNGDVIYGSLTGLGGIGPNGDHVVESLTITGGTGRFEGATGSLTLDRIFDLSTLPSFESHSGTLTGTVSITK